MKDNLCSIQLGIKRQRNEESSILNTINQWLGSEGNDLDFSGLGCCCKGISPPSRPFVGFEEGFLLRGGAKSNKKSVKVKNSPRKKAKVNEGKASKSKLDLTVSPKMKKKTSFISISFADESIDLTQYTTPIKKSSSPRKSPKTPPRKVKFDLDQNTVLEFDKKNIISRSKKSSQSKSSKSILKTRTSPRKSKSP